MTKTNVGILSIGTALPEKIRSNSWWSEETVKGWRGAPSPDRSDRTSAKGAPLTEGARRISDAMARYREDPFQGAVSRRVLDGAQMIVDLEARAAAEALEGAGVTPKDVDLLLGFSLIPDHIGVPSMCALHNRLGLAPECFTMNVDAICNSFQAQLTIAEAMITSGKIRTALLVQSSAIWRTNNPKLPLSVHFGDGATAVLVGTVSSGRGLLSAAHRTDGSVHRALVCTVESANWWDDGRVLTATPDRDATRRMVLMGADCASAVVTEAIEKSGFTVDDIDFLACHQPTAWFQGMIRDHLDLGAVETVDIYSSVGTLSAANLPLVLHTAEATGKLHEDDLVLMYQIGSGMTYSASLLRWGT
jgi:3-oxoacyl-[acyl-carrier-protein] synthase III